MSDTKITEAEYRAELERVLSLKAAPPDDWGGCISTSDICAMKGVATGGSLFTCLKKLATDGTIRSGNYRYKGGKARRVFSVKDVLNAVKEGVL